MAGELAKALVAAAKDMPKVEPDAVNPHFKSKFVSLDHLIAKTRPVLAKHGLVVVQEPCGGVDEEGAVVPGLKTTIMHESGEERNAFMPLILGKQDMQGLGAAITYARRYAWASLLGISEQEDDDGNQASAPGKAAPISATKKNSAPDSLADYQEFMKVAEAWRAIDGSFDLDAALAQAKGKPSAWLSVARVKLEGYIEAALADVEAQTAMESVVA